MDDGNMKSARDLLSSLAQRLRKRAAEDMHLAQTKLSERDSFSYVVGRAKTLEYVAEEIEAALDEFDSDARLKAQKT